MKTRKFDNKGLINIRALLEFNKKPKYFNMTVYPVIASFDVHIKAVKRAYKPF